MTAEIHPVTFTFAEYMEMCSESDIKLEYLDGRVYAMAGGTPKHAFLAGELTRLVGNHLQGKPCRVASSDLHIRVKELGSFADVTVVCGALQTDPEHRVCVVNPTVVFEVTSPSSRSYDSKEKFRRYSKAPSLRDYVLVFDNEDQIEVRTRLVAEDRFATKIYKRGEDAFVPSIELRIPVDALYDAVKDQ